MADGLDHLGIIPGVNGVGVAEQQYQIDLVIGDPGVDLLMAALFMTQKQSNGQTGIIGDEPTGGGGSEEGVLTQYAFISSTELHHQFFFLVVSQKCDVHTEMLLPENYRRSMGTGRP